jgi:hypothetical protein
MTPKTPVVRREVEVPVIPMDCKGARSVSVRLFEDG